jgi:putative lipoic acid-binding regulatory protein
LTDSFDDLLEFPTHYSIRVIGVMNDEFEDQVFSIVSRHVSGLERAMVRRRPSKGGKYISVMITFVADSRPQLETIYKDLNDQKDVLMLL